MIFRTGLEVGKTVSVERLMDDYHVLVLAGGAEAPRDLPIPGRDLQGVHFAMDYLVQQNRRVAGLAEQGEPISAMGKNVVVIGGGDTGSDCVGTANRQGALSVTQLEIMPQPPLRENKALSWPYWPMKLRTSSSQEEGCGREYSVITRRFVGEGSVRMLECEQDGRTVELPADLILLAMGFTGAPPGSVVEKAGVELDPSNVYRTSRPGIFSCGDMRRGQSLVVWAIREGRDCAQAVDQWLTESDA